MASTTSKAPHACQYCQRYLLHLSHEFDTAAQPGLHHSKEEVAALIGGHLNVTKQRTLHKDLQFITFQVTLNEVYASADLGCLFAKYLLRNEGILDLEAPVVVCCRTQKDYVGFFLASATSKRTRAPRDGRDKAIDMQSLAGFDAVRVAGSTAASYIGMAFVSNPNSKASFDLARFWLRDCLSTHATCNRRKHSFMPTRLIEVLRGPDTYLLQLIETKDMLPHAYATLSYCWGSGQSVPNSNISDSVANLSKQINFDALPASIRDAVIVTFELGLRYLWVDAICIMQDNELDKSREIALMSEVYEQATITIAGSRANDAQDGFLQPGKSLLEQDQNVFRLPFACPSGQIGLVDLIPSKIGTTVEPMDERAWTLQERILSKRYLEYGLLQTRFYCRTMYHGPLVDGWRNIEISYPTRDDNTLMNIQKSLFRIAPLQDASERHALLDDWCYVVSNHTNRKLGLPADRLRSIGGVAKKFAHTLDDEYLAGLWRSNLVEGLLWSTKITTLAEPAKEDVYIAPSWSWARNNNPVELFQVYVRPSQDWPTEYNFQVLEGAVDYPDTGGCYGAVTGGCVKGTGYIYPFILTQQKNPVYPTYEHTISERQSIKLKCRMDALEPEFSDLGMGNLSVNALLIKRRKTSNWIDFYGLLLRQLDNGTYSRLGCFQIEYWVGLGDGSIVVELWSREPQLITIV
jgi:hypothetical protein